MDLPKDTVIFNNRQTKKILNGKQSYGNAHVNGTLPNGLIPLSVADSDKFKMLTGVETISANVSTGTHHLDMIDRNVETMVRNVSKVNNINNSPTINVNNPQFTCTGVTGEEVLHQIEGQFQGLFTNAYQNAMKR